MSTFSKRHGYQINVPIQFEAINEELRNRIWNLIFELLSSEISYAAGRSYFSDLGNKIITSLWDKLFKYQLNKLNEGSARTQISQIREEFFSPKKEAPWYIFYDALELIYDVQKNRADHSEKKQKIRDFESRINIIFQEESAGYRFIEGKIIPITNELEIEQLKNALTMKEKDAKEHLSKALTLYSHKTNPDYANAIKEAISCLEAYFREISGSDKPLSDILKEEKINKKLKINSILLDIISKVYAYRGEVGGIAHSSKKDQKASDVEKKDALLFIMMASILINYLRQQ